MFLTPVSNPGCLQPPHSCSVVEVVLGVLLEQDGVPDCPPERQEGESAGIGLVLVFVMVLVVVLVVLVLVLRLRLVVVFGFGQELNVCVAIGIGAEVALVIGGLSLMVMGADEKHRF